MKRFLVLSLLLLSLKVLAQNINPGADEIYREDEIAKIYLIMASEDSVTLLDDVDVESNDYLPTSFQFVNSLMDTTLEFNVGIRLRGNTSRYHPKKSLKIKFKEFDGSKFYGYKKFNLKADNNDPTVIREPLTLQVFREANVAATRTNHVEVYINGGYMGLYINVEQLDDEFVDSRFGNEDGNLYKCGYGATLEDNSKIYDDDIYELKTNEEDNDRSILANFVEVLNTTSEANFQEEIEKIFDVQLFIRYLAVEAIVGHWDGYSYNQNNFYLYENPDDGLIKFMPYDVDNTFGLDWVGRDWGTRDVLDWPKHGEPRPLTKRILAVDSYFNQYVQELYYLLDNIFTEDVLFPQMDMYKEMLSESNARDAWYPLTFGFTHQDFLDSYTIALGGEFNQLPYGLKPYVTTRIQTAEENLPVLGISDNFRSDFNVYPNPCNGYYVSITTETIPIVGEAKITDMQGKLHNASLKMNGSQYRIDFDNPLPSGLYFLQLNGESHKLLVQ